MADLPGPAPIVQRREVVNVPGLPPQDRKQTDKDTAKSLWDEYIKPVPTGEVAPKPASTPAASQSYPPCYGKMYDPDDPECTQDCAADGWAETCKSLLEEKSKVEKRKAAKRLVQ